MVKKIIRIDSKLHYYAKCAAADASITLEEWAARAITKELILSGYKLLIKRK